jgi:ribonuclease P protein component
MGSSSHPPPGPDPVVPAAAPRPAPDQRLGRGRRLTRTRWFREAYDQGRRRMGRYMVLWLRSGEGASLRLGVVSSRKVGNAVRRARARRRLRELFRRERDRLSGPYDVVLVGRAALVEAEWSDLVQEFRKLAEQAGILIPAGAGNTSRGKEEKP